MFVHQNLTIETINNKNVPKPSRCQATRCSTNQIESQEIIDPEYEAWLVVVYQLFLRYRWLYKSTTPEIATQVMGYNHVKDLWDAIKEI